MVTPIGSVTMVVGTSGLWTAIPAASKRAACMSVTLGAHLIKIMSLGPGPGRSTNSFRVATVSPLKMKAIGPGGGM